MADWKKALVVTMEMFAAKNELLQGGLNTHSNNNNNCFMAITQVNLTLTLTWTY